MILTKEKHRKRRHHKIRSRVSGTKMRPRLVIHRSLTGIYAQMIDDNAGKTIVASSSLKMKEKGQEAAKKVGADIAKKAQEKKVKSCVFDRGGYLYHGRVKALAEAAREAGLQF